MCMVSQKHNFPHPPAAAARPALPFKSETGTLKARAADVRLKGTSPFEVNAVMYSQIKECSVKEHQKLI